MQIKLRDYTEIFEKKVGVYKGRQIRNN